MRSHCMVTLSGIIFVIGGYDGLRVLSDVFKLSNGVWSKHSSLNTPRFRHMCAVLDDSVLVIGGSYDGYTSLSSVEVLTSGSTGWVEGPSLPTEVYRGQVVEYDNSLYVLGGYSLSSGDNNKVYRLNSAADLWTAEDLLHFHKEVQICVPCTTVV